MTIVSRKHMRQIFLMEFGAPLTSTPSPFEERWIQRAEYWHQWRGRQKHPKLFNHSVSRGTNRVVWEAWQAFCHWHNDYRVWWLKEQARVKRSHTV